MGDGRRAHALVLGRWRALEKSFLLHVQYVRGDAYFLRARCALAAGLPGEAVTFARKLDREGMDWTRTLAALVWAGVARAKGDREAAALHLRVAVELADATDMRLHGSVARLRLAELGAGDGGGADAIAWMTTQGITRPDRVAAMLAPPAAEIG